ncbi:hypothetical protein LTR84_006387 [Exophiala bonariae]|uniref:SWR1-complex protein 5 n=1 Tax=Exophiala bonariae TaxID=1690606 RepID=A0AAV9N389_9EURO|nr:hypothetical protein LTR84_006387 [Exophiala bonariae]
MAAPQTIDDIVMEDASDEDADSDFHDDAPGAEASQPSSDDDDDGDLDQPPAKKRKVDNAPTPLIQELDSGDEATIKEQKKHRRKQKKTNGDDVDVSDNETDEWRARTRAMRDKEKDERKKNNLATSKGSTIDVDKIWEEMNRPATAAASADALDKTQSPNSKPGNPTAGEGDKENRPVANAVAEGDAEEIITIKRTYKFAGEIHTEEKTVAKSSAEAQLWLSQHQSPKTEVLTADGRVVQRPLRTYSRFDPNLSKLEAFKSSWLGQNAQNTNFKGPKLNVVEKSKMDWAVHVDSEGLKDELETHGKSKEGYLNRMDFLRDVEQRKESEARDARLKGPSPLPRIISDPTPPVPQLTALTATPPALSRASTLPSSPLDEVPERLWDRVLRTSGSRATETNNPNLSLEEIISTRLSLDEHRFLSPKIYSSSPPHIPHTATMGVQKVFKNGVKSLKKKVRRIRRSIFSKNSRVSRASPATVVTPATEGAVSNTSRFSLTEWLSNQQSNPPPAIAPEVPEPFPTYPQDRWLRSAEHLRMANLVRVTNARPISAFPQQITSDFIHLQLQGAIDGDISRAPQRHTQQPITEVARRGLYYMDAPSQNPDLFWNNRNMFRRRSFSSDDPPRARIRRLSFWRARNPVFRYPSIHQGAGEIPGYTKVAYYSPCSIEQKPEHLCGETCIPQEEGYEFGPDCLGSSKSRPKPTCVSDLVTASLPSPPRAYDAVLSDYSRASLDGQASIRSQFERDELMEEPVDSFSTGRLSRALSTVFRNTDFSPN